MRPAVSGEAAAVTGQLGGTGEAGMRAEIAAPVAGSRWALPVQGVLAAWVGVTGRQEGASAGRSEVGKVHSGFCLSLAQEEAQGVPLAGGAPPARARYHA